MLFYRFHDDIIGMVQNRIKLSKFAKQQGMAYISVYKHWQAGNIEGIQLPSGTILVSGWVSEEKKKDEKELAIIYSRVFSPNQKNALKTQTVALTNFAHKQGYEVIDTVEEVGPGFSDRRTKLLSILHRKDWDVLIVEDTDNFMKFGFPYVEVLLRRDGQQIISFKDAQEHDPEDSVVQSTGEQELINLITRTRNLMKGLIGVGGQKIAIEKSITALVD